MEKWSSASIHDWWNDNPWPCGFNYLPSTAVNFLEFWHQIVRSRDYRTRIEVGCRRWLQLTGGQSELHGVAT